MSRTESFLGIEPGDVVAVTGGGGKTTLIHSVAQRLVTEGKRVLLTATRPFRALPGESRLIFVTGEQPIEHLAPNLAEHGLGTVAPERLPDGRLAGFSSEGIAELRGLADYLFVEADDARGESLPPPDAEREVPESATVLLAVAGLDGVGEDRDEEAFAAAILDEQGPLRCRPELERRVLCLNRADRPSVQQVGARVAREVFRGWSFGPEPRILLTSVREFLRRLGPS